MNINVQQLVYAFYQKNIKLLYDFINQNNRPQADIFKMFVTAGFYALQTGDQFVAHRLAQYLQIRLENPQCIQAFLDILRGDYFTDQQLQFCINLLEQNFDRSLKSVNLTETLQRYRLYIYWKSELTQKLQRYGYNATYRYVISKILPNPTLEDAAQMLLLFSSPQMINTNKESVSQLNKEFQVSIEVEANQWMVDDVFYYLKEKDITVVNVVCSMKLQNIFYSPQTLLENTIVALNAQNPQQCYCSACSLKSSDGFIETVLKNFEMNKYVRMTYCIGILTLCHSILKQFSQKVYFQLLYVTPEIVTAFNKISMQAFYVNIGRTECCAVLSLPDDVPYQCPLYQALDLCSQLLYDAVDSENPEFYHQLPNRKCCLGKPAQHAELEALMQASPQAPIVPLSFLWRSISLLKTLKTLYDDFPREVEYIFSVNSNKNELYQELDARKYVDPVAKCPEQLSLAILHMQPTPLLKAVLALSINRFLVATGQQRRLDDLQQRLLARLIGSPFFAFSLQIVWRGQFQFVQNVFAYIERYKIMQSIVDGATDFQFMLDVISRCSISVVAQQLNYHFLKFGAPFAEAVSLYIIKKLCTKKLAQSRNFDMAPYSYACVPCAQQYIQCTLRDFVQEASRQVSCSNFDYELKNVYVSPVEIPEHIVHVYYKMLTHYAGLFRQVLPKEIAPRCEKLFSSAFYIIRTVHSNIDYMIGPKPADDAIIQAVRRMFTDWARQEKRGTLFNEVSSRADEQPQWLECVVDILSNSATQQSFFDEFVGTQYEDMCAVAYLRLDLFKLIGYIIGAHAVNSEQLPRLLNAVIQHMCSTKTEDIALARAALVAMGQQLRRRQNAEMFSFFADFAVSSPAAQNLKDDDVLKVFKDLAGRAPFRIAQLIKTHRDACQTRQRENERILQDKTEFMLNSFQDEQIFQFIVDYRSLMRLLQANSAPAPLNEQCKKAFDKVISMFAPPNSIRPDWKKHIPAELQAAFMQDRAQFAEFYVQKYIVEMDTQQCCSIPQLHDNFLELLIYLKQPELLHAISYQCILTLMRLVFAQNELTPTQLYFRRQKATLIGSHLGKMHFRAEVLGLSGLSSRELDFPVLIALAARSATLSVASRFFCDLCQVVFTMNDFITPRCGYFREVLEMFCVTARCKHSWNCTACRATALAEFDHGGAGDRFHCYSDLDWLCGRFYPGAAVGIGEEHEIEIVQKETLYLPQLLLEEQNISILQRADVYQVPLNLTAALVQANQGLVWSLDCIYICQRSGRVQQVWSRYVDHAYEMAQQMLDFTGIKQTCDQYQSFLVKYAHRIANALVRNACLMNFAQEILDEVVNRFQFEDWVPEKLYVLIYEKILYYLSLMAAEHVLSYIYKQIKLLILLRNQKLSKSAKYDYSLQDNGDFDGYATPYDEKSNYMIDDGNDDDLLDKLDILTDIFPTKPNESRGSQVQEKILWEEIQTHENYAVFPFVQVHTSYQLLCHAYLAQNSALALSSTDFCSYAQSIIAKGLGVAADIPIAQQMRTFLENSKFESDLERYLVTKYVVNQCAIIGNVSNYVPLGKPMAYDEAMRAFARLSKSLLSMQNQLASGSHYSSLISLSNLSQNHPLNVQLHALRVVFGQLWRCNYQLARQHITTFFQYALSAVSVPQSILDEIQRAPLKCSITSTKQNLTTLYDVSYTSDYQLATTFQPALEAYQNYLKAYFLAMFPQDSKIFEYLKDDRQLIKNLCLVPHSCRDQVSLIQSLPFAIFYLIQAVYQDNSYAPLDIRNMVVAAFQRVIDITVHAELCGQVNYRFFGAHDCIYAFIVGVCRFNILKPDEVDKIFWERMQQVIYRFCAASQQLGVPYSAIYNKCVLTLAAATEAFLEVCYNISDDLTNTKVQIPLSCFPLTLHAIEELYVASIETIAIIARSSQSSSGQNESLFAAAVNLPQSLENLLFLQYTINQGVLQQKKPALMAELSAIGFDISLTNFCMGTSIQARMQELYDTARRQMKAYEAQHQRRSQNGGSMLDNQVQEVIKCFYAAIEDNCCYSRVYQPLLSNAIKDLYALGYMSNDYYSQCIIDSLLFSTFYSVFQDCKRDVALVAKKLRQIDTLCLLFYYLVQSIPELEIDGTEKQSHLALILFRVQQFYAVFSSLSVSAGDKQRFLQSLRNYDLLNVNFNFTRLNASLSQQLCPDLCCDASGREQQIFSQLSNIYVHRVLFSLYRAFLHQQTFYNRAHRVSFAYTIAQALYAFRPQHQPQFVSHYVSLLSESTLLCALLRYCPDFSFRDRQINFIEHRTHATQPTFYGYFALLEAFCLYCHGFYGVPNQHGLKQYVRVLLRLLIVLARDFPEFISQYRLRISEALHWQANQLRSYLYAYNGASDISGAGIMQSPEAAKSQFNFPPKGVYSPPPLPPPPQTDDISGLLALPQTDFHELLEMDEISENMRRVLFQEAQANYAHDVIAAFKQQIIRPQLYSQIAPVLHYIIIHLVHQQMDRKRVEDTTGFKIVADLLRDLITQDFGKFIVAQMFVFVANPSVETYAFAAVLQALAQQKNSSPAVAQFVIQHIKYRAEKSYGCQILARMTQLAGK